MTRSQTALAGLLSSLVLATGAFPLLAISAENPYQDIIERNVFSLKPPPPPPTIEAPKPPTPKLKLTGLITFFNKKQALITAPPAPATKPGDQPREQSYILPVGQMADDIKVLEIDEKAGWAKVDNHGSEELLYLPTNAPAMTAGTPSVGVPGAPPPTGFGNPNPVANPYGGGGMKTIPTTPPRVMRTPQSGYTPAGAGGAYGG